MERVAGIEPASSAWKAEVLPLNYTRGVTLSPRDPRPTPKALTPPSGVILGGGGWIRTTEARASDLQSDPFGHSGTPPEGRTFSRSGHSVSTGPEGEFCPSGGSFEREGNDLRYAAINHVRNNGNWSWREESNPRPADYKSAALPTELRQLSAKYSVQ